MKGKNHKITPPLSFDVWELIIYKLMIMAPIIRLVCKEWNTIVAMLWKKTNIYTTPSMIEWCVENGFVSILEWMVQLYEHRCIADMLRIFQSKGTLVEEDIPVHSLCMDYYENPDDVCAVFCRALSHITTSGEGNVLLTCYLKHHIQSKGAAAMYKCLKDCYEYAERMLDKNDPLLVNIRGDLKFADLDMWRRRMKG